MRPCEHTLGVIVNYLSLAEQWQMLNGYLLTVGWDETDDELNRLREECEDDGITDAGEGRFSGTIRHTDRKP